MEPIRVAEGVRIPEAALSIRAVRSSGPGGQNVNKVASKVDLRVDLARIEGLDDDARERLLRLSEGRRDAEGRLMVVSQLTRDQKRNIDDARSKIIALVARALVVPRHRRKTRPSAGSRRARLEGKRRAATLKQARGRIRGEDD